MKMTRSLLALLAAGLFTVGQAWAQDTAQTEALEPADAPAEEAAPAEAPAEEAPSYDVWWGHRSISNGNYLKFDRITVDAMGPAAAPLGPVVFDTLHFDRDKSVIRPEARAVLSDAVRLLQANPGMGVLVEVEASATPLSAAELGLSQRRADAVRMYLIENGIAAERISTATAGEARVTGTDTAIIPISNR